MRISHTSEMSRFYLSKFHNAGLKWMKCAVLLISVAGSLFACVDDQSPRLISMEDSRAFGIELPLPVLTDDDAPLTAYPSERELELAKQDSFDIRGNFASIYGKTLAPIGLTRAIAEFEANDGVLISWSRTNRAYLFRLILAVSSRVKVWVLTSSLAESAQLKEALVNSGASRDNLGFFEFAHESVWTRDYGPLSIVDEQGAPALVDVEYYYNRRRDDAIPTLMARYFSAPVYRPDLAIEGGNFMTDGEGRCFFSSRVLEANASQDTQDLSDLFYQFFGCEQSLVLEPLIGEGTGHIDMFSKLIGPNTMLMGYYRYEDDPMNAELLDRNVRRTESFAQESGWDLKIVRVPMPRSRRSGAFPSYTNSLIVNDLVIIPVYPQQNQYEVEALESYRQALGNDYQLVTLDADLIIEMGGAVHCTTMGFNTVSTLLEPSQESEERPTLSPVSTLSDFEFNARPNTRIEDLSSLTDTVTVTGLTEEMSRVVVKIDVVHTYPGDLKISLYDGEQAILLLDRERVTGENVQRQFTLSLPANYNPNRVWSLIINDLEAGDEGILKSWSLSFTK